MKVKILDKKGPKLDFLLEETDPAFANSLRRIMISEVPTLAVQWADIHDNNSALFDEVLSHRLGLIPLRFDPKKFNFPGDCECNGKGCPLCQVVFIIDKKGPSLVTSADLKSSDRKVAPADPRVPIVQLLEGQSLRLEAVARLGTGLEHARHQAANASYQYYPEITVKGSREDAKKAVDACPKGIVALEDGKVVVTDPARCDLCRLCMEGAEGVEMKGDDTRIIFHIESISGLEPEYIVARAAEIIAERAAEFKKKIEKI